MSTVPLSYFEKWKVLNTKKQKNCFECQHFCSDRGYAPNQITYNAVILAAAYGDVEDLSFKKMFELFDEMVISKEIPPTDKTFGALIVGCGNICDIETATKCLHLSDKMGIKRTAYIYECYLKAIASTVRTRRNFINIGSTKKLKTNDLIRLSEGLLKKMEVE